MKRLVFIVLAVCVVPLIANQLSGALSPNLDNVIVYPNPFQAKLGHTKITFDNLTGSVRIKIYKTTGELIYDKQITTQNGSTTWDLSNSNGSGVASGIYIYIITGGGSCSGKLL